MSAGLATKVYATQKEFIVDPKRYTAFIGGRNSGKTYSGSIKALLCAARGGLGCIAAPSFPMLEHGAKAQFLQRLDESGEPYTKTRDSVLIPRMNAEVLFVTLESESRVRGPNYAWGWADEVEYVTDRKIWRAFKGAVRDGAQPQLFVTSTPKGRRLVWDEWVVGKTAHHALYKATTFDNPFIDAADYVAGLGYEGVFYEQEITADFVTFEGLVYPAFDRTKHAQPLATGGWAAILGVDAGVRNPTAILTLRFSGERRHVEAEVYRRGMGSRDLLATVEQAADECGALALFVDPSAAALITDLERDGYPVVKANNDVMGGIREVTALIGSDLLSVDPGCVNTIAEFESYAYPDNKRESDNPVKAHDHALDALRYACMGLAAPPEQEQTLIYDEPIAISAF